MNIGNCPDHESAHMDHTGNNMFTVSLWSDVFNDGAESDNTSRLRSEFKLYHHWPLSCLHLVTLPPCPQKQPQYRQREDSPLIKVRQIPCRQKNRQLNNNKNQEKRQGL
jgi:hypothetical protein